MKSGEMEELPAERTESRKPTEMSHPDAAQGKPTPPAATDVLAKVDTPVQRGRPKRVVATEWQPVLLSTGARYTCVEWSQHTRASFSLQKIDAPVMFDVGPPGQGTTQGGPRQSTRHSLQFLCEQCSASCFILEADPKDLLEGII